MKDLSLPSYSTLTCSPACCFWNNSREIFSFIKLSSYPLRISLKLSSYQISSPWDHWLFLYWAYIDFCVTIHRTCLNIHSRFISSLIHLIFHNKIVSCYIFFQLYFCTFPSLQSLTTSISLLWSVADHLHPLPYLHSYRIGVGPNNRTRVWSSWLRLLCR